MQKHFRNLLYILLLIASYFPGMEYIRAQPHTFPISYRLIFPEEMHHESPQEAVPDPVFLNNNGNRDAYCLTHTGLSNDNRMQLLLYFLNATRKQKHILTYPCLEYATGKMEFSKSGMRLLNDTLHYTWTGPYYYNNDADTLYWKDGFLQGESAYGRIRLNEAGNTVCCTLSMQHPFPPYDHEDTLICITADPTDFCGPGFTEFWTFDNRSGAFTKEVKWLSLWTHVFGWPKKYRGDHPLLNLRTENNTGSWELLMQDIRYDVFFDEWNQRDNFALQELMGEGYSTYNYISTENRALLLRRLLQSIESGTLTALDPELFESGQEVSLDVDQVFSRLDDIDSIGTCPYPPYEEKYFIVHNYLRLDQIIGLRFIEDWYTDPKDFAFHKAVKIFALLRTDYDHNTGQMKGYTPVFYLRTRRP